MADKVGHVVGECWCSGTQVGGKSGIGEYRNLKIGNNLIVQRLHSHFARSWPERPVFIEAVQYDSSSKQYSISGHWLEKINFEAWA